MRKPTLFVLFLIVFVDLVGFGIVLPLLPLYSEKLGASGLMIGCIVASYNLMQFFFAPWLGKLSDRIGRRPIILLSTAGSAISYALFGYASGLWHPRIGHAPGFACSGWDLWGPIYP